MFSSLDLFQLNGTLKPFFFIELVIVTLIYVLRYALSFDFDLPVIVCRKVNGPVSLRRDTVQLGGGLSTLRLFCRRSRFMRSA